VLFSVVLSCAANQLLDFPIRQVTDLVPILISDIIVDFYRARVKTVPTPLLAAGNPIVFPGLPIKIVRFESASRKRMESASLVVQGLARLGKGHTTNTRRSADFVAFAFDVHDATFHRFDPTKSIPVPSSRNGGVQFYGTPQLHSQMTPGRPASHPIV
jgi:hypothetical protein